MYVCLFLIRKGIGVKEKGPLIYMESMWSCSFLSFSKGSCGMFEFTDVDIYLCKSVWPSAEDWISTSCCRLPADVSDSRKSQISSPFFPLCFVITAFFRIPEKWQTATKQDQTAIPLFFQCISKFLSTVSQLLPIAMVKIESQSLSGRWLFSKFIFCIRIG